MQSCGGIAVCLILASCLVTTACLWPTTNGTEQFSENVDDSVDDANFVETEDDSSVDPTDDSRPEDEPEEASVFASRPERLIVEIEVHRVEAPAGVFGEESPIWKIATTPFPNAASELRLRTNGFLAAVGRDSDRPDLVAFLESLPKPAIATDRVQPDSSRLVDVEIGTHAGNLTLFHFDEAGSLRGMEVENPTVRFRMRCEFRSSNLRDVWLEVMPELEEAPGPSKWVIGPDERARLVPQERRHTFKSVAFGVEIPKGGFLLLGAVSAVYERPLLAKPFFLSAAGETKKGQRRFRESIYVIRPIIRAVASDGVPDDNGETPEGELPNE